jgi:hypothetical protein
MLCDILVPTNDDTENLVTAILMNGFNDDHLEAGALTEAKGGETDAGLLER